MLKYDICGEGEYPTVSKLIVEYTQEGDCEQDRDEVQVLRLETEDGGAGPFIRMSIPEGKFFSVSNVEELKVIFDDFEERLNYTEDDNR